MEPTDLAWLAGFLDGEGSVGMNKRSTAYVPAVQLSSTCIRSVERVQTILRPLIGKVPTYVYLEKDPTRHRDAVLLHVTGIARVSAVAKAMLPYSVTKSRHWELILQFTALRLAIVGVDEKGNLRRGGDHRLRLYGTEEVRIYEALRALNRRGPGTGSIPPPASCPGRGRPGGRPEQSAGLFD